MAIVFDKALNTANLRYAFNNNVIEFRSNTIGFIPAKAEIIISSRTYTIYPDPANKFWFNFKNIKSVELNVNNYADTVNADLADFVVYDWTNETLSVQNITVKIYSTTNIVEQSIISNVYWLNGYVNLFEYKRTFPKYDIPVTNTLTLLKPTDFVKYWAGYPFDLSFYNSDADIITFKNLSNSISYNFDENANLVDRLFFSDGRTDVSIEDYVPLNNGYNKCRIESAGSPGLLYTDFLVEKISNHCGGHYLKWMNSFGGWSYWLFYKGNETLTTKDLGEINNDYSNLEDTISPIIAIGKESSTAIELQQELITESEMYLLSDLLESVKVYLFTGIPFTKASNLDWLEVSIKPGSFRLSNSREKLNSLKLTIEIPQNVSRIL